MKYLTVANDKDWQRRSDQWVKAIHESRLRKEKVMAEKKINEGIEDTVRKSPR